MKKESRNLKEDKSPLQFSDVNTDINEGTEWRNKERDNMPRPRMLRFIRGMPRVNYFKPAGIPLRALGEIVLTVDEFEAVRLRDLEGLTQTEAAKRMRISQPTFQRIYDSARKKIAQALVEGKALRIEGGTYRLIGRGVGRGPGPGFGGRGRGFRGGRR